jgi:hypothetical protein
MFWTPAFAGVTLRETFYEFIKNDGLVKSLILATEVTARQSRNPKNIYLAAPAEATGIH